MNLIHKIEHWGDTHHPRLLDIFRIALGLFLLFKGIAFMMNSSDVQYALQNSPDIHISAGLVMAVVYIAAFVHMVGGMTIALGILTRVSSLIQIPVVFGAVFFVNIFQSPLNTDLLSSVICLVLLVVFAVLGSGRFSLDKYLDNIN